MNNNCKKPRMSAGNQEPGGQEERVDDLGSCLARMEDICLRAGELRKYLEFDKLRMARRMETLKEDNILLDIRNILGEQQSGAEDGGGTPTEIAADQLREDSVPDGWREPGAGYPITTPHRQATLVGRGEMIEIKKTLAVTSNP